MRYHTFQATDPISVIILLILVKLECGTNVIHKDAAL